MNTGVSKVDKRWMGFAFAQRSWGRSFYPEIHGRLALKTYIATELTLPLWFLNVAFTAGLFGTIVAIPLRRYRRRSRRKAYQCLTCGYNLTGNESGVCPECSTPVPKREPTA